MNNTLKCPICGKEKDKKEFKCRYNGKLITRIICRACADKMSTRLTLLANADMSICQELGLNFLSVTDYEAKVRKEGGFIGRGSGSRKEEINEPIGL